MHLKSIALFSLIYIVLLKRKEFKIIMCRIKAGDVRG